MADIKLAEISHSYAAKPGADDYVLRNLDLVFADGGAYALLGPSGCGKTTTLNIISGLIRPTSGQVLYGDSDVTGLPPRRRNIAQVFQFPVIYDTMTVFDNLAFPLRNRGVGRADIERRVKEIAGHLQLDAELDKRAANLTPDLKQVISLGRGLVRDDVAAILLDEPLTVIDPQRKWELRRKLRQVHEEFRHTSIYVTHDQTEALTFADTVVVMHEGEILQHGTPEELFERPTHTFVGYFIGTPGMNVLPCELADRAAVVAGHRVPLSDALWGGVERADARGDATFELGIRPKFVTLGDGEPRGDDDGGDSGDREGLPATVTAVEDHGGFRIVVARVGEHTVRARLDEVIAHRPGDDVRLRFPDRHLHLYRDHRIVGAG